MISPPCPKLRRLPRARAWRGRGVREAEHIVYRPAGEGGFDVARGRRAHSWRPRPWGVELLVARHDLSNLEALDYLEQRLREIGVIAALERRYFEPGDGRSGSWHSSSTGLAAFTV